jgi:DNA primase catalytic subunit
VLDTVLRNRLGLKQTQWFFSGGRGVHGWVTDFEVWRWTKQQRELAIDAIVAFCREEAKIMDEYMGRLIASGVVLGGERVPAALLRKATNDTPPRTAKLDRAFGTICKTPESRWAFLTEEEKARVRDLALVPRPDRKVTTDPAHLIKIPLGLHPRTMRVCSEMDPGDPQGLSDL